MTAPTTHFSQFDILSVSPSGERHSTAASGYLKELTTTAGGALDFGSLDNSSGIVVSSPTKCVVWVVDNLQDATTEVFDMKFWLSSVSDWVGRNTDYNSYFNQHVTNQWLGNVKLNYNSGTYTPTSLPAAQNLLQNEGNSTITASGTDAATTEYIYLSVSVDSDTPVGIYGSAGGGGFRYRVTYKYV